MPNYWGFRINTNCQKYPQYYRDQLENHEVLRQGWGYEDKHNLSQLPTQSNGEYDWERMSALVHELAVFPYGAVE